MGSIRISENRMNQLSSLELTGKKIDQYIVMDNSFPYLSGKFQITGGDNITKSGFIDGDYPQFTNGTVANLKQLKSIKKVPLPRQIMQHQNWTYSRMGIFPEISRAWLVLDSDIFMWDFESGLDIASYDGMQDHIIEVGLVKPKPGVLDDAVQFMLILITASDIVVIGVACEQSDTNPSICEELRIVSNTVLYSVPTDGVLFHIVRGTKNGRIFLGGSDGNLYELSYRKVDGWWGRKCQKVNISGNYFLQYLPSLFTYQTESDVILQIAVDDSRYILYTLSTKGNIVMYDLGADGTSVSNKGTFSFNETLFYVKRLLQDCSKSESIIHISAVDVYECLHVGLVAVTNSGIRVYFIITTCNGRPVKLHISHLRVPPGYNGNIPYRPYDVHLAHYSEGNLLMIAGRGNVGASNLWCISGDIFPYNNTLTELFCTLPVEGESCIIRSITQRFNHTCVPDPPLVVRQLYEPSKKFVILSTQGVHIIEKLRPVDILAELFFDGCEPGSEIVKNFFQCFAEDEACAMLLLLACQQTRKTTSAISAAATRAFLLYSGEPKGVKRPPQERSSFTMSNVFNPRIVSTPIRRENNLQRSQFSDESPCDTFYSAENDAFNYSPKHNSLYMYISRILRPLWSRKVVSVAKVQGKLQPIISESLIEYCKMVNSYLSAFNDFLTKSPFAVSPARVINDRSFRNNQSQPLMDAYATECKSVEDLKSFVDRASQVIGLWRVLYDHGFHTFVKTLPEEQQSYIQTVTFRELILSDNSICHVLINKMLSMYLGESGLLDAISSTLQTVCPAIFLNEDIVHAKASNVILQSTMTMDSDERSELLNIALKMLKEVAPKINLEQICKQFENLSCFHGIYELSSFCAKKVDEHDIALRYYQKKDDAGDPDDRDIYERRMDCYKYLISSINELYKKSSRGGEKLVVAPGVSLNTSGNFIFTPSRKDYCAQFEELFKLCVRSEDELLHCALYDWVLQNKLENKLLENPATYLENYLLHPSTMEKFGSLFVCNILWNYYVLINKPIAAAETLFNLAKQPCDGLKLQQRIDYLNTGLMLLRGDKSGTLMKSVLLRDMEDMYQIALVQRKVQKMLESIISSQTNLIVSIEQLNQKLCTLTELYEQFAHKYNLWECILAIIDCSTAVRCPKEVIYAAWDNVISSECDKCTSAAADDKMNVIVEKVAVILSSLKDGSSAIDLDYLIRRLEMQSCQLGASKYHVHSMMVSVGISYSKLISTYNTLYTVNSECWTKAGDEFHIVAVIGSLGNSLADDTSINTINKRVLALHLHDMVTHCLNLLYSRRENEQITELISNLRNVQRKLNKIL